MSDLEFFQNEILGELDWSDENIEANDDPASWARAEIKRLQGREKPAHMSYWATCSVCKNRLEVRKEVFGWGNVELVIVPCKHCATRKERNRK